MGEADCLRAHAEKLAHARDDLLAEDIPWLAAVVCVDEQLAVGAWIEERCEVAHARGFSLCAPPMMVL